MPFLAAEHFVQPPQWTWYILFYFFFAGIAGGSYVLATLLRFGGEPRDEPAARLGFYVSLAAIVLGVRPCSTSVTTRALNMTDS